MFTEIIISVVLDIFGTAVNVFFILIAVHQEQTGVDQHAPIQTAVAKDITQVQLDVLLYLNNALPPQDGTEQNALQA